MNIADIMSKKITNEEKKQAYLDLYEATNNEELKAIILEKIEKLESTDNNE